MKRNIWIPLLLTLAAAWGIFHFKDWLGPLVLPLYIALVIFVTLKFYRLMEKDDQ
ncbi:MULTISPECIES: hypothetical protein [Shewanella]|jgi:hypothetical protein|uniref:Uncharacterized protein n=1 Tax=Shewanella fodinae TaxID=552357 RepID=A0A4R2FBP6_9GAMM|nr:MULTISPECIES: hypothetical protein [Shewanella]MDN5369426.1 hypothetical protein [Shewanella sp.]MBO1271165.1 hypothetical protein [Shewanella sp. 4t3-1-2LB]MCD8475928.1 hypothetical protein [Shewanella fodinae]MCL2905501.1 hypothetical protein [Shewanella fodinae]TCN82341.1 hypothetical protein EDC91_11950 [Shewanella fodinae]